MQRRRHGGPHGGRVRRPDRRRRSRRRSRPSSGRWPPASLTGLLTGVAVVGLLPVLEALFKRTTDITLLELTDYNHPLLRRMQLEAPGTYHHSLVVAQLSENACNAIGANPAARPRLRPLPRHRQDRQPRLFHGEPARPRQSPRRARTRPSPRRIIKTARGRRRRARGQAPPSARRDRRDPPAPRHDPRAVLLRAGRSPRPSRRSPGSSPRRSRTRPSATRGRSPSSRRAPSSRWPTASRPPRARCAPSPPSSSAR